MGMEKMSFVKNGGLKLPPGFRFHPTDEELVVEYLKKKVFATPLPASIIPEVDVCKSDPWDLPGNLEQERYFFSTNEAKYTNGYRTNRATSSGYWKATGLDKQIVTSKGNQVVGMKKTLVFYRGKSPRGSRTDWIMHEYRLVSSEATTLDDLRGAAAQMENWVLCRVFLKNRGSKNDLKIIQIVKENGVQKLRNSRPVFYEFLRKESNTDLKLAPACSSSSGSSGVTEVSCNGPDDHEESSRCNSFPYFWSKPQTP